MIGIKKYLDNLTLKSSKGSIFLKSNTDLDLKLLEPATNYNVEDFPLAWIEENNFATYSGNTFQVAALRNMPTQTEYDSVTNIFLDNQSLTTDFTNELLGKFSNLNWLNCYNNSISILDVSNLISLTQLRCYNNSISVLDVSNLVNLNVLRCENNSINILDVSSLTNLTTLSCGDNSISILDVSNLVNATVITCGYNSISVLDVSNLTNLTTFYCFNNSISVLDVSNLVNITDLRCQNNQIDAATNSQILIDLDNSGLSNGYFRSSIFGGGSLTTAGQTAKLNLLSKGWTIVGI